MGKYLAGLMKEITQIDAKKTSDMAVQRKKERVQKKDKSGRQCLLDLPVTLLFEVSTQGHFVRLY